MIPAQFNLVNTDNISRFERFRDSYNFQEKYICIRMIILITEAFNWTVQPTNPTQVVKGEDVSLTWQYTLTADEKLKSQTFYGITWKKLNQSSLNYEKIGSMVFTKFAGVLSYSEPKAPHIEIDKNDPATLLIKNVRREDEGTYKIEYSLEFDGTVLADHEVNVTVLGKFNYCITNTLLSTKRRSSLALTYYKKKYFRITI